MAPLSGFARGTEPRASRHRATQQKVPHFTLATQNVYDLHERADSQNILHLHGEITRPYCERCRQPHRLSAAIPQLPADGACLEPPRCTSCGGTIRPGVVWFGEALPQHA